VRVHSVRSIVPAIGGALLAVACVAATRAQAGVKIVEKDDFTLELGLRLQPRLEYERLRLFGEEQWQRDFLVRRTRFKVNGKMMRASYYFEWKIDRVDQLTLNPSSTAENAWIQFPLGMGAELKAGLYDLPFSRDRLTSDSRQLAVDRGAVSNVPDALGLADNTVGVEVLGKARDGHLSYVAGLFDNRFIRSALQDVPMVGGRLDLNLGSTKDIFQDAHFGDAAWYSLGINANYQPAPEDTVTVGADDGMRSAMGVDGMLDVPFGPGRLLLRGEVNAVKDQAPRRDKIDTAVWMVGGGYLLSQRFQPIVRFDQTFLDDAVGGGTRNITYVGANYYLNGHSLKVQGDLRFEGGTGESVDGGRLQAQLDY
jgi:hypothetical protein